MTTLAPPTQVPTTGTGLRAAAERATQAVQAAPRWTGTERVAMLAELDAVIAQLTMARAELLLAQREAGTWQGSGDRSFEAWRARTSRTGLGPASTEVRRADAMVAMPAMKEAVRAGEVGVEHLDVVGKVAAGGSAAVRTALASPQGQAELIGLARRLDAGKFAKSAALWAATVDSAALERTHQAQRAARFLHLVDTAAGTKVTGQLDRMTGHRLRLALEAVSARPAADDDRTSPQRHADALETIAEKILALPDTGSGAAVRPHVSFLMSAKTWAALHAGRDERAGRDGRAVRNERDGRGQGSERARPDAGTAATPIRQVAPVTLEDGTPVPPSEVARVLCDCELTRIVLDTDSEPIDLGRTARTYTGVQRRAVIARDGGCLWPGCDMAARWCEVHHIKWWDREGGATSVHNGALACSFHHHQIHTLDLTITRHALDPTDPRFGTRRVRYTLTLPDGTVIAGRPPGRAADAPPGATGAPRGDPPGDPPGDGRHDAPRGEHGHALGGGPGHARGPDPERDVGPPTPAMPTGPGSRSIGPGSASEPTTMQPEPALLNA